MHESPKPLGNSRVRLLIAFLLLCAICGVRRHMALDWQTAHAQGTLPDGAASSTCRWCATEPAPTTEQKSLVACVYFGDAAWPAH
ncbi:MAG: hypothetical protein R2911_08870 [Caldilineaceae bacterium]